MPVWLHYTRAGNVVSAGIHPLLVRMLKTCQAEAGHVARTAEDGSAFMKTRCQRMSAGLAGIGHVRAASICMFGLTSTFSPTALDMIGAPTENQGVCFFY